ncbi:MAG: peptide chain release factor N(5)-glutamine methyltransferase [Acidobacteria bacterium]|nr:MAG: peptide chain release factor N(5)-glutamine methyltransferase [Acidobacteriota bacterium]TDI16769.1 MAG: peptide chain release factor N(5)-glutamine methyltransferase [Acidobacteriota bacterium]
MRVKAVTVQEALQSAADYLAKRRLRSPRQDADLLVASVLKRDRTFLYTHPEHPLSTAQKHLLQQWLIKRGEHFPLQYLRGKQEFYGREFSVRPGVFIPRPETELVLEAALGLLRESPEEHLRAIDVGTGSGCIGITLACEEPRVVVTATDVSPIALQVAHQNAKKHRCLDRLEFREGQTLNPVKDRPGYYHLVVSNPPYVSHQERNRVDASVDKHEPHEAVYAAESGQAIYKQLFSEARKVLRDQGKLVVELGEGAKQGICRLAQAKGWVLEGSRKDLAHIDRCAIFGRPLDEKP